MAWINTADRMPVTGQKMQCRLKHCFTGKIVEDRLVKVAEDDCSWRTADDNAEIDYSWDVTAWLEGEQ
jgi:hypothetical protein